jgi:hypothetical protein
MKIIAKYEITFAFKRKNLDIKMNINEPPSWVNIKSHGTAFILMLVFRGHHGCYRMAVAFTTTYAISTYHH